MALNEKTIKKLVDNYSQTIVDEINTKHPRLFKEPLQKYLYSNRIGSMAYLYRKFGYPTDHKKFFNMYIESCGKYDGKYDRDEGYEVKDENDIPIIIDDCGRSLTMICNLINEFYSKYRGSFSKLTVEDCFYCWYHVAFISTMRGLTKEKEIKDRIEKNGYYVRIPSTVEDQSYGIDLIVCNMSLTEAKAKGVEQKVVAIIQVKPNTYFLGGNTNQPLMDARKWFYKNIYRARKRYSGCGIYKQLSDVENPTAFIVYIYRKEDGKWLLHPQRNNITFLAEELVDKYGNVKLPRETFL